MVHRAYAKGDEPLNITCKSLLLASVRVSIYIYEYNICIHMCCVCIVIAQNMHATLKHHRPVVVCNNELCRSSPSLTHSLSLQTESRMHEWKSLLVTNKQTYTHTRTHTNATPIGTKKRIRKERLEKGRIAIHCTRRPKSSNYGPK